MTGLGHKDRSKAIQAAMHHFVSEHRWSAGRGRGVGALMVLYDSRVKGLEDDLVQVQHRYGDLVTATLHLHLGRLSTHPVHAVKTRAPRGGEENCLELIAVRGTAARLRSLTKDLTSRRGVKQVKLTIV